MSHSFARYGDSIAIDPGEVMHRKGHTQAERVCGALVIGLICTCLKCGKYHIEKHLVSIEGTPVNGILMELMRSGEGR